VELSHLSEIERICSYHAGAVSSRRSPSPVAGRQQGSSITRTASGGDIEDKHGRPRRPSRAPQERVSPRAKNKSVSPERVPALMDGRAGGKPLWDSTKAACTTPPINITANSGVQLQVEQHQAFLSMLRPSATGYFNHNGDMPLSSRRNEDRSEPTTARSGCRSPSDRSARRHCSPTAHSRSATNGASASRSLSPQPVAPMPREGKYENATSGAAKCRWSPPDMATQDGGKAIAMERRDPMNQEAVAMVSARRQPPPKGGVVAPSFLQNLPAHRDLTSEEAKKRASSLQSLLAFAAEVQARQQTEAPSTGASSCQEDEPQREPPVTPPAPTKVPTLVLQQQQLTTSLKDQAGSEEKANRSQSPQASLQRQAGEQLQNLGTGGCTFQLTSEHPRAACTFQAPSASGSEAETPRKCPVELVAEPPGPTRVSSASSLGTVQISCVIATSHGNVGRQAPQAGPARAASATSPRVRVRPPECEFQKTSHPAVDAAIARNAAVSAAHNSAQIRSKNSPLWPQPQPPLAKFGQQMAAAYGQPRFTQANSKAFSPTTALPRVHSPSVAFTGQRSRGNSFGPVVSRTDYATSPRSPTAILPQAQ
jgi:hypothetical protein